MKSNPYAPEFPNGIDPNPQKAYQDWLKKNNSLIADRRLPAATQLAALYLQGHLYLLLEDEKDAVGLL